MTTLAAIVRRGDFGPLSPLARRIAILIAALVPLLAAGVAVTALQGTSSGSASAASGPLLPAAVVNLDQPVNVAVNGQQTPVLAGKLLVSQLTSGTAGGGFTWDVTDATTAANGLASGAYSAVVTIPSSFSAAYTSLSGTSPQQAQLQVQTNGASGYLTGLLAAALSENLQSALSADATSQFVTGVLGAFSQLHDGVGQLAGGAGQLASGAGQLASASDQLASGAGALATGVAQAADGAGEVDQGAQALAGGLNEIADATSDVPGYAKLLADGTAGVSYGIGVVSEQIGKRNGELGAGRTALQSDVIAQLQAVIDDPGLDPAVKDRLQRIRDNAAGVDLSLLGVQGLLTVDNMGVGLLGGFSQLVNDGAHRFADDLPYLTTALDEAASGAGQLASGTSGLASGMGALSTGAGQLADGSSQLATGAGQLASGSSQLASGLQTAAAQIPDYSSAQQKQIATVVATPVVTDSSDLAAPPGPVAAIAAVAVPLALWLGAFASYLVLVPVGRKALAGRRSSPAVLLGGFVPALWIALVQWALVSVILLFTGVDPGRAAGAVGFALLASLSFTLLHQGLVALLGQAGRLISLGLLVLQLVAAAVIAPSGLSSGLYSDLAVLLPLSHAVTGMQALLMGAPGAGGLPGTLVPEVVALVVTALVGFALGLVAVARRRRANAVVAP